MIVITFYCNEQHCWQTLPVLYSTVLSFLSQQLEQSQSLPKHKSKLTMLLLVMAWLHTGSHQKRLNRTEKELCILGVTQHMHEKSQCSILFLCCNIQSHFVWKRALRTWLHSLGVNTAYCGEHKHASSFKLRNLNLHQSTTGSISVRKHSHSHILI